jgi:hypothetical protein
MKTPLPLKWALLLAPLVSFANSPPPSDNRRIAMSASEISAAYPQLFRSDHVDTEFKAKPPARGTSSAEVPASSLYYDASDKRVVSLPARQYLPKVEGLTAESVSLRRNSVRFNYTFR